jgi:hypothetical protein
LSDDEHNPGYGTIAGPSLDAAAELLGVDPDSMRFALTNRQVQTGNRASIAVKQLGEFAPTPLTTKERRRRQKLGNIYVFNHPCPFLAHPSPTSFPI